MIEAIAATMRAKARRRRRNRSIMSMCAVAAAAVCVAGGAHWRGRTAAPANAAIAQSIEGSVLVVGGGRTERLTEARPLKSGEHVVALQDGHASLILPSGSRIAVEGGGDLALLEQGQTQLLGLGAGAIRADVTKLGKGERFIVRTSDAEVEVRGTSFRVAQAPSDPSCGAGTTTRVTVYEGVVLVRAASTESSVSAGQVWPKGCRESGAPLVSVTPPAVTAPPAPPQIAAPQASHLQVPAPQTTAPQAAANARRSELAAQNDLFDEATAAKRRGDTAAALSGFERFLVRYPSSPLTEHAASERMRLLATIDPARATAAAKDYLAHYPTGFARADAEAIMKTQP